jgi:Resolvase, N terminal domain/Recombinase
MARLKTQEQVDQERKDAARHAIGNFIPDTNKLLLIYARQSSSKQYVSNIYSAMEQRDGLLERASELGWISDEQRILYVENQLAKKTHVSGSLRIDQRKGLQALTEVIESGKASAVLVVSVDRITRDEDLITPTQFANLCKKYGVVIITDDYIYDFNNPKRDDMGRFMNESIASKEYVRKQIKGKMLKNRTRKANMGRVANGTAPIGLMLDESILDEKGKPYSLIPSPHAERVDWIYGRFRAHDANLGTLLREVINMAKRGEPLFPDHEDINPKTIRLKRMKGGWTVSTRFGLKYILTNPMYAGHLVFNGRIVKRNAHPAIVNLDNWQYAFEHLSDVDLDGQPIYSDKEPLERQFRATRAVKGEQSPHKAMDKIKDVQPTSTAQGDLELTNQDLATVERRLRTSEDVMSDEDLRETYAKKARLIKRRAELKKVIDQKEKLARKEEQGKKDVETAGEKWAGWSIEERRSFIRLVTESTTLEEIASGWLRLTLVWSPIMGFVYPLESNTRAVDTAYIWREFGAFWTEDELAQLRAHYPTMGRAELLRLLPNRSWQAISGRAKNEHIIRTAIKRKDGLEVPTSTSLSDLAVLSEFMLDSGKRVQWQHYHIDGQVTNEYERSRSPDWYLPR